MRKIANNTLVYVYIVSYEHMVDITIVCMMCVMVIEIAVHFVMVSWIAWLTVSLCVKVVQKSVSFTKRSVSTVQLLHRLHWLADSTELALLFYLKLTLNT